MSSATTTETRVSNRTAARQPPGTPPFPDMVWIPGGVFLMGSDRAYPEEAPAHRVQVDGFWMDRVTVTNLDFERFVSATGYVTLAEKPADPANYPGAKPEMLAPSSIMFKKPSAPVDMRDHYNWWVYVRGANWRHPRGSASSIRTLGDHPGVHVPTTMLSPMPNGQARSCRPKRNGSLPLGAA